MLSAVVKMGGFLPVFVALAALCAAISAAAEQVPSANTATSVNCLSVFNEARVRAGLDPFIAGNVDQHKLPIEDPQYVNAVCKSMQEEGVVKSSYISHKKEGTYAFAQQMGETGDCAAALSHWSKALAYFDELPPVYTGDNAGSYATARNRSFVALFNPMKGASIECAYFICPLTSNTTTTTPKITTAGEIPTKPGSVQEGEAPISSENTQGPSRAAGGLAIGTAGLSSDSEAAHHVETQEALGSKTDSQEGIAIQHVGSNTGDIRALVCLTNPQALVSGRRPFS